MPYDLGKLPIGNLLLPLSQAAASLSRLDERIARSAVGNGWIERTHFTEACASLWIDGELVHLEDLVLHDATHDIRTPTHELTIARDVLKTRRRIVTQPADWALSAPGLRSLRSISEENTVSDERVGGRLLQAEQAMGERLSVEVEDANSFDAELAAIDAVLARSERVISEATAKRRDENAIPKDPLLYDLDWDENERMEQWCNVLRQAKDLPPILQTMIAIDAWDRIGVLQHGSWLGRLLASAILRDANMTTGAHLVAINNGLRTVPIDRRRHRDREVRLLALAHGLIATAEIGLKEHDRMALARQMMERKLRGRRTSSKLPELIDLVMAHPIISTGMVAKALNVTPQAARRIVAELGLREMTGRGRFRAWGIV